MSNLKLLCKSLWEKFTHCRDERNKADLLASTLLPMDIDSFYGFIAVLGQSIHDNTNTATKLTAFVENVLSLTGVQQNNGVELITWEEFSVIVGVFEMQQKTAGSVKKTSQFMPKINYNTKMTEIMDTTLPSTDSLAGLRDALENLQKLERN